MLLLLKRYGWVLIVVLFFVIVWRVNPEEEAMIVDEASADPMLEEQSTADEVPGQDVKSGGVVVDVKGEVVNPGIYEMDQGTRVNDAINMAGGMTERADETSVNLALKVQDEMVILVSEKGIGTDEELVEGEASSSSKPSDSLVRINQATSEEIQVLQGIGPSKADAIVQYREENGWFNNAEDLLEVSGIGEKTLEQIKEKIQVP
ncbi:helix-hairpin-helix domain-containing protein [Halobacillus sp. A1]|uniref:helix-hairpin-helix domain-containing protein n=1 Tax=Halobacillus sp. A1 TaxID=2880262 RepID=UPI0020A622CF|nr:helix-hairpin-helix domain-containing protein [Halobacillus sp. A1]MCP3030378.1 helix-hairpin-helix domain-containing protein [Halobacillus sp. A1]